MTDELVDRLNEAQDKIGFVAATDAVVAGHDLASSANGSYGAQVAVVTRGDREPPAETLVLGRRIGPGQEPCETCRLIRREVENELHVALVDAEGAPLSRTYAPSSRMTVAATRAVSPGLVLSRISARRGATTIRLNVW